LPKSERPWYHRDGEGRAGLVYEKAGERAICAKVVDVLGWDTSVAAEVTV
jgi:hypothetical protein